MFRMVFLYFNYNLIILKWQKVKNKFPITIYFNEHFFFSSKVYKLKVLNYVMNNKKLELLKIFSPAILTLIVHTYLDINNIYQLTGWMDLPMHFLGGVGIGVSYFLFLKFLQRENYLGGMHKFIFFVFVISLVSITAVGWELFEFFIDLSGLKTDLTSQPSVQDTMVDFILGILGGIIGYVLTFKFSKR